MVGTRVHGRSDVDKQTKKYSWPKGTPVCFEFDTSSNNDQQFLDAPQDASLSSHDQMTFSC